MELKQKKLKDGSFVFYRVNGNVIQIIATLTEEEILLNDTDPSLLEEEQIIRIEKVLKEIEKDGKTKYSNVLE